MPFQGGNFLTRGTINNITYRHSHFGWLVGNKSNLSRERVLTSPDFAQTRLVMSEFKRAALGGSLIRHGFKDELKKNKDRTLTNRMQSLLMHVVEGDTTHPFGQRTVEDGDLLLMKGMDFNIRAQISQVFSAPYSGTVDRVAGTITIDIPSFVPINDLEAPTSTTHFKLFMSALEADFASGVYSTDAQETAILPWDTTATTAISQSLSFGAGSVEPLFAVLGVSFYKLVNGDYWEKANHQFNFLNLVVVDKV
jgi:hypothetical protein